MFASIHEECGYTVARQVHCPSETAGSGTAGRATSEGTWDLPGAPCHHCGASTVFELEEAVLDLDVRSARVPRTLLDVTVRYGVPGGDAQLAAAARGPGAVNRTAEMEKRLRYPDGRTHWSVVPFAVESFGRLGPRR